jgi:hypothetical protein
MREKEHGGKEKAAKRKVMYKCPKLDECNPEGLSDAHKNMTHKQ